MHSDKETSLPFFTFQHRALERRFHKGGRAATDLQCGSAEHLSSIVLGNGLDLTLHAGHSIPDQQGVCALLGVHLKADVLTCLQLHAIEKPA